MEDVQKRISPGTHLTALWLESGTRRMKVNDVAVEIESWTTWAAMSDAGWRELRGPGRRSGRWAAHRL